MKLLIPLLVSVLAFGQDPLKNAPEPIKKFAKKHPFWVRLHFEGLRDAALLEESQPVAPPTAAPLAIDPSQISIVLVTLKPETLKSTKLIWNNSEVGIWTISVTNQTLNNLRRIDRSRLLAAFINLNAMPNNEAQDLLDRKTALSKWQIVQEVGKDTIGIAPAGLGIAGALTKTPWQIYSSVGLGFLTYLVQRNNNRIPNPSKYYSQFLPDQIALAPGVSSPTYYIVASLVKGAHAMQVNVPVPTNLN